MKYAIFAKRVYEILVDYFKRPQKQQREGNKGLEYFPIFSLWMASYLLVSEVDTLFRMSDVLVCMCSRVI